jgi:hypothetical protein
MAMAGRKITWKLWAVLAGTALLFLASSAFAGPRWTAARVPVLYGPLRLVVNGQDWQPRVKPFVLQREGVVVVPLRELAAQLGLPVRWEAATATVVVGQGGGNPGFPVAPVRGATEGPGAQETYTWLEDLPVLRNVGPFYRQPGRNFRVAGRALSRGVAVELEAGGEAEVVVDLAGRYRRGEGYLGIDDTASNSRGSCVVSFYGDDVLLFHSPVIKPADYPFFVGSQLGNLNGVKRLRMHVRWQKLGLGDYDRVVCVLARFRFFR